MVLRCFLAFATLLAGSASGVHAAPLSTGAVEPANISGSATVDAEELVELAQQGNALVIIDSRLQTDRQHGYIEGSVNLPDVDTDCDRLTQLIPDTNSPALFYCNGPKCGRSARAVRTAIDCGYRNVFWFRGGLAEWLAKDYPVLHD